MKLYILTRCCERPHFYLENRLSIAKQNSVKDLIVTQLVSCERQSPITHKYLSQYLSEREPFLTKLVEVERQERKNHGHFPYNLYCNQMHQQVDDDSWVMYLDDDDIFMTPDALDTMQKYFNNPDQMLIWKCQFPDGTKPSNTYFKRGVRAIGYPAICFCFHSKWLEYANWDDRKGSDSRVIYNLSRKIPKIIWINRVLTSINYAQKMGGFGQREDKISSDTLQT